MSTCLAVPSATGKLLSNVRVSQLRLRTRIGQKFCTFTVQTGIQTSTEKQKRLNQPRPLQPLHISTDRGCQSFTRRLQPYSSIDKVLDPPETTRPPQSNPAVHTPPQTGFTSKLP